LTNQIVPPIQITASVWVRDVVALSGQSLVRLPD
jgi:hypothetical protein